MKKETIYSFPETDFNYVSRDFLFPMKSVDKEIEKLIKLHEIESRSVPFFLKSDTKEVEQNFPTNWKLEINTNKTVQPESIRIVIYNAYWRAERNLNEGYGSVSLKAIHIGGDFMIIDDIIIDEAENITNLLLLERSIGNSPTMISISPGAAFKTNSTEFSAYEVEKAIDFIQNLKLV